MNFLIDTPPPTISGNKGLHIGHIFSYTQADIYARYRRYMEDDLLYPWCFDNNGLPTYKSASNKKIQGTDNIISFSKERGEEYRELFEKTGIQFSGDTYHTYSDSTIRIAHKAFHQLKEKGLLYKAETEFLWCPIQKCSISQSELDDNGLIEKSGAEPIIKKGWGYFINIKDHKERIKEKICEIEWYPEHFRQRALDWADNIEWDWSISRERYYGIQIPGEENMTFDTWFISALSPQLAWNSRTDEETLEIPIFDLRFQGHDIIRSWAFYTITMSCFLNDQIPWRRIMITGHTLDGKGDKYSKSSGNATDPRPLIEKYGQSGIRWWASRTTLGNDIRLDEDRMKMGWRLENKLKNAKKFIDMQIDNGWTGEDDRLWQKYNIIKMAICSSFMCFNFEAASDQMYSFFWNTFCDQWIEKSKKESCSLTLKKIIEDFEPIMRIIL